MFSSAVEKSDNILISIALYVIWFFFWDIFMIFPLSLMFLNFTMTWLEDYFFFHYLCRIVCHYSSLETLSFNSRKTPELLFFDNFLSETCTTSPGLIFKLKKCP